MDASPATKGTTGATGRDTNTAINTTNVRRTYGDVVALNGVDLHVESGTVFGLIGPNGAGKTTLVRALTGTTAFEGTVRIFGSDPRSVDTARIGLLPQSFDPPARLTARELVAYYGGLYDEARDVDAVLNDVGMTDDADVWYESLSGGQKRRTCVATALVNDPDLLLLDEPTTGIDPAGRQSLHRLIERLATSGTTVFLTSHAMDEVERLADQVALLRGGRVVASGAPASLIAEHGGRPRLDVSLSTPATDGAMDQLSTQTVGTIGEDVVVAATETGLRFVGVTPETIGSAVDALEAVDITFESLTWREPSLEDVYLRLSGETYTPRPDEARPAGGCYGGNESGNGTEGKTSDESEDNNVVSGE